MGKIVTKLFSLFSQRPRRELHDHVEKIHNWAKLLIK